MKENIRLDFEKYGPTIINLYQHFYFKRLMLVMVVLVFLITTIILLPITFMKIALGILLGFPLLSVLIRNVQYYRKGHVYVADMLQHWQLQAEAFDPGIDAFRLYEDPDNYYLKLEGEAKRFLKKGSRTLPSTERGLSLIVAENSDIFSETPLLVHYCDTTELKYLNLAEMNEKLLKQMKLTRLKNKLLPPVFVIIILGLLYFYLF